MSSDKQPPQARHDADNDPAVTVGTASRRPESAAADAAVPDPGFGGPEVRRRRAAGAARGFTGAGSARRRLPAGAVVLASYALGAVPVMNVAARLLRGVDLRTVGTGTVSGTSLYKVAGFGPLAVAGCLELAKGAAGPLLAGRDRPYLAAVAAGASVTGHNWSPFLGLSGGRGLSLGLGALLPTAPEGTLVLGAGLGFGRLGGETGLGSLAAIVALPLLLGWTRGRKGVATAACLTAPMVAKRLLGDRPPEARRPSTYVNRFFFDSDTHRRR